ncbi:MAG: alanine racemase, partial [Planctomycetota bacterium]|nr:alanine racemase [Planctomycetota bacterium]
MEAPSRLEISLSAIEHNIGVIRRALAAKSAKAAGLCAVIKDDAYGLGAARIAKRLEGCGVEMLAVFTPEEARSLIAAAVGAPILILMPVREFHRNDALYRGITQGRIHMAVHDEEQLKSLADHADRFGVILPLHLEVNTGMSRGGARPEEAERMARTIARHARLRMAGVFTHFCAADRDDAMTRAQAERFEGWLAKVGDALPQGCIVHQA